MALAEWLRQAWTRFQVRWKAVRSGKHLPPIYRVEHNDDGFRLVYRLDDSPACAWNAWTEVISVYAYKLDNYTDDTIWLEFQTQDHALKISEEYEGYSELVDQLPDCM